MSTLADRLLYARKQNKLTQTQIAEKLNVSFQAVSLWERGETSPDIDKLPEIATLFHVTTDWLLTGKADENHAEAFPNPLSDRLFDETKMYTYIKTYAITKNLTQTLQVLPYAREKHEAQFRKGKEKVPYIYHPLLVACHALALGLDDDNMISTALLHDVCEDCGVAPEDLPVNEETKVAVALLTKTDDNYGKTDKQKKVYYSAIAKNPIATMIKLLDRCQNISGMAAGFSKEKMINYSKETETWFYPLLRTAKTSFPMYSNQIFLLRYHMKSVIETIKHQL